MNDTQKYIYSKLKNSQGKVVEYKYLLFHYDENNEEEFKKNKRSLNVQMVEIKKELPGSEMIKAVKNKGYILL